jgi:hypothetical protein
MEKHDYDSLASRFLPYLVYLTEAHSAEKIWELYMWSDKLVLKIWYY